MATKCPAPASSAPYGYDSNGNPLPEQPLDPVYPELWASGARAGYALLARAIPGLAPLVTEDAYAQAAYANAARNSIKGLFRGPAAPLFSGLKQPDFAASLAKSGGNPYSVIASAARTNGSVNSAFAGAAAGALAASPPPGGNSGCP